MKSTLFSVEIYKNSFTFRSLLTLLFQLLMRCKNCYINVAQSQRCSTVVGSLGKVMEAVSFFGFTITVLILLNHFLHRYWSRRGFTQLRPNFFVGDIGDLFRLKKSIAEIFGELYAKSKSSKIVGLYFVYRPALLINDTNLIQNILVKDFPYFVNHGLYVDEKRDPLSGHLFSLHDEKWKNLRTKLSPLFSPSKLKLMFPTFLECAVNLQNHVNKCARSDNNVIEIRDLLARYTTDIIASVAYGFDNDSINNPDNIFRLMGAKVFKPTFRNGVRALITFLMPKMTNILGIRVADRDVEDFMFSMVKETIAFREKNNRKRNDLMQVRVTSIRDDN
jgi:cytochrome P450 family 6